MTWLEIAAIFLAGIWAGGINTVVGSGTLITFPMLLAFGVPPVTANVSNSIGLVPGSISGAIGYRRELVGQRSRILRLAVASTVGSLAGAALLLALPSRAFSAIVPVLVLLGLVLVVLQPRISAWVARRHDEVPHHGLWWVWPAIALAGVYGGYFGAAQGILLMAILGIGIDDSLQRLNGVKNILGAVVNIVSGVVFAFVAEVDWTIVVVIGLGAVIGGQLGAHYGRRLPAAWLRAVIVTVGIVALGSFVLRG